MPAARAFICDEHGVRASDGTRVLTVGVAPEGGIFVIGVAALMDADTIDDLAGRLRELADNARITETARLLCEGCA